jgi:hypothetical protein
MARQFKEDERVETEGFSWKFWKRHKPVEIGAWDEAVAVWKLLGMLDEDLERWRRRFKKSI